MLPVVLMAVQLCEGGIRGMLAPAVSTVSCTAVSSPAY